MTRYVLKRLFNTCHGSAHPLQPGDFANEQTINDFLNDRAYTGDSDSDYCAQMKALCLLQRATRYSIIIIMSRPADEIDSLTCPRT